MNLFFKKLAIILVSLSMFIEPQIVSFFRGGEDAFFSDWSPSQSFSGTDAQEFSKDPDRDFVILNLTDLQLSNNDSLGDLFDKVKAQTDRMVRDTKPDLITLTGDNAWGDFAYVKFIKWIDSYGIPWAPVFGNHDPERCPGAFWVAYNLAKAKHCLFRFGPKGMGYGNYILNITQNGDLLHSLILMDTHTEITAENINGTPGEFHYDHLWGNQMQWYSWAIDGIAAAAGHPVESTVLFHIPMYEYKTAWQEATGLTEWHDYAPGSFRGDYAETGFGIRLDPGGWPERSNGFFDLLKEKGSTKNVLCGHDHRNSYSLVYQGIRLTFALKDGPGCYWLPELNGCTTLTIDAAGHATPEHHDYTFEG